MTQIYLYVCVCKQNDPNSQHHWLLMTRKSGSDFNTWYFTHGSMSRRTGQISYKLGCRYRRMPESSIIEEVHTIGYTDDKREMRFENCFFERTSTATHCQEFIIDLLSDLEVSNIIHLKPGSLDDLRRYKNDEKHKRESLSPFPPDSRSVTEITVQKIWDVCCWILHI